MRAPPPVMVDVAFALDAPRLPEDYEWPLYRAIVRVAPWLARARHAGLHAVRATHVEGGGWLVAKRARLVLRIPRERICAVSALEDVTLALPDGTPVRLGSAVLRRLEPAPTLHAARVVTGDAEEAAFGKRVRTQLDALGIPRPFVCGRRSEVPVRGRRAAAFALAVHGLGTDASLLLQNAGLGDARAIGCGLFVPHKTIAIAQ